MTRSNLIDIEVEVTARTDRAVLVHTGEKEKAVWISLSHCEIEPSGFGRIATLTLPEWLATDKGLV